MRTLRVPVDDGSVLVLAGLAFEEDGGTVTHDAFDEDGEPQVLGPVSDFLQSLLMDGALLGVTGHASYDLLKALAVQLRDRLILLKPLAPARIDDVRRRVSEALVDSGNPDPVFAELTQYGDRGWEARGTVGGHTFEARTDSHAQVIHLRLA